MIQEDPFGKDSSLSKLFSKIYLASGLDFTQYKRSSILRRLHARMRRKEVRSYDEYIKLLDNEHSEYNELLSTLAINVTDFFRNPEVFDLIRDDVIPAILDVKIKKKHRIIKVWSAACASGEEVYSLAILFLESLKENSNEFFLNVIGTDIDKDALLNAEKSIYSADKLTLVKREYLSKYFTRIDNERYSLKKWVKDRVKFQHHDVIRDNPILFCDLVMCRNLLIYFNRELQEEMLLKLSESMNPGAYLVLGMAESLVGSANNIYEAIDYKLRIYHLPKDCIHVKLRERMLRQTDIDEIIKSLR